MSFHTLWTNIKRLFGGERETYVFVFIFFISIILRFINYNNRFVLASDQARDVLIVLEAIHMHKIPLIGPFSASGPFVFGPYWYWIFTIPVFFFQHSLLAPWIFQSILYVCAIPLMFFIGKELYNPRFGILLSLFTAISTSEIKLSTNLIFSALVGFLSFLILYLFILYIKNKKLKYLLILSLLISIAINTHFEAIPLIFFILFAFLFGKRNIFHLLLAIMAFILPFIPLLIFNIQSHNFELSHIMKFHQTIPKGISLFQFIKAELGPVNFFPRVWGDTIGGSVIAGWIMIITFIYFMFFILKKRAKREEKILIGLFICVIVSIIAYEGRLFENFLGFVFPFMILFTSLVCYYLIQFNKTLGFLAILLITFFSLFSDFHVISNANNIILSTANFWENSLIAKYPDQQFAIYNYSSNTDESIPLSLLLYISGKTNDTNGLKIGVANVGAPIYQQVAIEGPLNLRLYTLENASDKQIKNEGFSPVTPSKIYASVEDWYK